MSTRRRRPRATLVAATVVVAALAALVTVILAGRARVTCSAWPEGRRHGGLVLAYGGYGTAEASDVGGWHTARVTQTGDTIAVKVDGRDVIRVRDAQRPYRRGHAGLYTEDAAVRFTGLRIT